MEVNTGAHTFGARALPRWRPHKFHLHLKQRLQVTVNDRFLKRGIIPPQELKISLQSHLFPLITILDSPCYFSKSRYDAAW